MIQYIKHHLYQLLHRHAAKRGKVLRVFPNDAHELSLTNQQTMTLLGIREKDRDLPLFSTRTIRFFVEKTISDGRPLPYADALIAERLFSAGMAKCAQFYFERFTKNFSNRDVESLMLQNNLMNPTATGVDLRCAQESWNKRHRPVGQPKEKLIASKSNKIRVGYLCNFFGNSISEGSILPLIAAHDRSKFEVFCYSDGEVGTNDVSASDHWIHSGDLNDLELTERIRKDQIHILHELNGFIRGNRIGVLQHRAAPIQLNWCNHPATTGVPEIDFVVTDRYSVRNSDAPSFTEDLYLFDKFCGQTRYSERKYKARNRTGGDRFVMGCFGATQKITPDSIDAWSGILKKIPNSYLILKAKGFDEIEIRKTFCKRLEGNGISASRYELRGFSPHSKMLEQYGDIDLALDPFPHSGGSTLVEALYCGIPVLTLTGERWVHRKGAAILFDVGMGEFVADSLNDYIDKAIQYSKSGLIDRVVLAKRMAESHISDMKYYVQTMEQCYQDLYRQTIDNRKEKSVDLVRKPFEGVLQDGLQ